MLRRLIISSHLDSVSTKWSYFLRQCSTETNLQVHKEKDGFDIDVPYRIPRGPTDILKVLSSTIKRDYLAPHYKYKDDPYFIPVSNVSKRSYALSKESGRKAARYFLEKYPEIFKCHTSEPLIKAFQPPVVYTETDTVTEDTLKSCIESTEIENAIMVYKLLKERDISVDQKTKQNLLELLCFYNCEQPPQEDYTEERWFAYKERPHNTWKNNGEADKLFQEMDKDATAYCAMIQGNAKFLSVDRAITLYEELCGHNFRATIETYNSLLTIVPYVKDDGDVRWQYAVDLCKNMESEGLQPNLSTMNALLNTVAKSKRWNKARAVTMQILSEMQKLNIEPSLGTYFHVLTVFFLNSRGYDNVFQQIMSKIEKRNFEIRHPHDVNFFVTAMEICSRSLVNKDLAYCVNALLEHGNNCSLIGSAFSESIYFRNFLLLLCQTEDFDKFMEIYEKYVPNVYSPEPSVMLEIIRSVEYSGNYKHLLRFCSDVSLFEQTEKEDVMGELVKVAAMAKLEEKEQEMLVSMIWSVVEKLDQRAEVKIRRSLQWTGDILGNILKIFLNGNDLEKAWSIMQRFKTQEESIVGYPSQECIIDFCKTFLKAKQFDKVEFCVKYSEVYCYPTIKEDLYKIAMEMFERKDLDEMCRDNVVAICGQSSNIQIATESHEAVDKDIAENVH